MKQIYLTIIALMTVSVSQAQTLTQAANEANSGDSRSTKKYDSTTAVPKNTGAGQTWNFSSMTQNTAAVEVRNFTTSVPQSSMFPGSNLVEQVVGGDNLFWKKTVSPPQFELLGLNNPGLNATITFTNSSIVAMWPISMGYNQTDNASGTATLAGFNGTSAQTVNVQGTGTGTITLPSGGGTFSSILQVRSTNTMVLALNGFTITSRGTDYDYYHSSQKFPMFSVAYETSTITPAFGSPTISSTSNIRMNNVLFTGLNEKNFEATFQIFPNPAKDMFQVDLSNEGREHGRMEIMNSLGQVIKTIDLGNEASIRQNISISGLSPGIYIVKTGIGNRHSARRLVIE